MRKPEQFVGAWTLVEWCIEYADGGKTFPFGEDARGFITYDPSGVMTATVSAGRRTGVGLKNVRHASDEAKAKAFDSYFHYAGQWRIKGEAVVHTVELSLNQDMVGTDQVRNAHFDENGSLLTLSAGEKTKTGEERLHILRWKRCS